MAFEGRLAALFTEPEYFPASAALRSVTDWAHYYHRLHGLDSQPSAERFHRVSPLATDLPRRRARRSAADAAWHGRHQRELPVDIARLPQRLIELGKTNWDLAVFPVEDHRIHPTHELDTD